MDKLFFFGQMNSMKTVLLCTVRLGKPYSCEEGKKVKFVIFESFNRSKNIDLQYKSYFIFFI